MAIWHNESEMLHVMKTELYSSVIGDILDQIGYVHQFLPSRIQPLREHMVVAGRAMTVLEADVCAGEGGRNPVPQRSFGLMLEALDDLKKDEIYICSGSSPSYALVGELMCTRMKILGAAGCVVNGFHRDTRGILELDFPCSPMAATRRIRRRAARCSITACPSRWTACVSCRGTSSSAIWTVCWSFPARSSRRCWNAPMKKRPERRRSLRQFAAG